MRLLKVSMLMILSAGMLSAAANQLHYYAHAAVADKHGVIAPWYKGLNGQFDYRVRIAAETMKRYPWAGPPKAVAPAPEYIYNGVWSIDDEGNIRAGKVESQQVNGDLGQRAAFVLAGLIDYYRYSGDAGVLPHLAVMADYLIGHCQTSSRHGWPGILISVPTSGKLYGDCQVGTNDVYGSESQIQLDIVAQVGGRAASRRACVSAERPARLPPRSLRRSAASTPKPPPFGVAITRMRAAGRPSTWASTRCT